MITIKRPTALISLLSIYYAQCVIDMLLCLAYRLRPDTAFGDTCAKIALPFTGILLIQLLFVLPIGILLTRHEPQKKCISGYLGTLFCLVLWLTATCVFIAMTGGV